MRAEHSRTIPFAPRKQPETSRAQTDQVIKTAIIALPDGPAAPTGLCRARDGVVAWNAAVPILGSALPCARWRRWSGTILTESHISEVMSAGATVRRRVTHIGLQISAVRRKPLHRRQCCLFTTRMGSWRRADRVAFEDWNETYCVGLAMLKNLLPCLGLTAISAVVNYATGDNGFKRPELAALVAVLAAAGSALGNISSNFLQAYSNKKGKELFEKYITGWHGIDGNHRLYQTLRKSQINALRQVVIQYELRWVEDSKSDVHQVPPPTEAIRAFLNAAFEAAQNMSFINDDGASEQSRAIRIAALRNLSDTFGSTLATRQTNNISGDTIKSVANDFKIVSENVVLEELRQACFDGRDVSEGLLDSFYGRGPYRDTWHDLFIRDFSAKIRDEQDVSNIFQAELLVTVKAIEDIHTQLLLDIERTGENTNTIIHSIVPKIDAANAMLAQLVAESQSLAREFGIKEGLLIGVARKYAQGNPDNFDAALKGIESALEAARDMAERGRLPSNLSAAIDAVITRVNALNNESKLDEAQRLIEDALAALDEDDARRRAERARLYDTGLDQARLTNNPAQASRFVLARFDLDAPNDLEQRYDALRAIFIEWYQRGDEKGLNFELEVAIELAREAVRRAATLDHRGAMRTNLGLALWSLGERESGTARLEAAVAAYHEALTERTRDRVPLDWAGTQNNLGNALLTLGMRESGIERLEAAVAAYREALQERTRERVPLQWALTQNNLGLTLLRLGERESGTERLAAAVTAYKMALEELPRARVPLQWAMTQMNLGGALLRLGEREIGSARLEAAVTAFREALKEYTRERVPLQWAVTQMNLGLALSALGARERSAERLEASIVAYHEALQEYTRERVPLDWAMTIGNRAIAWRIIAERTGDAALARQALEDLTLAAQISREGGHIPNADFFESEAQKARDLVAKLEGN
jgi:tetratricopeptide (TPR) repeat protein